MKNFYLNPSIDLLGTSAKAQANSPATDKYSKVAPEAPVTDSAKGKKISAAASQEKAHQQAMMKSAPNQKTPEPHDGEAKTATGSEKITRRRSAK